MAGELERIRIEQEKQTVEMERQTKAVEDRTRAMREGFSELIALQGAHAEMTARGFTGVSRQLGQMSADISSGLDGIGASLSTVASSINFMSAEICKRLDALHHIVNNPLLTQAQELYRRSMVNYNNGFFEEALDDVKQAVEKYKTDYMSWFLMGHIYLYGAGKYSNVKNLEEAVSAFAQAEKYNSPNVASSEDGRLLAAEIYFYLGAAQEEAGMFDAAVASCEESYKYSGKMFEALYSLARLKVKQNQTNAAIGYLEKAILSDRNYAVKVFNDPAFAGIKREVDALIIKLRRNVFLEAQPKHQKILSLKKELEALGAAYKDSRRARALTPQFKEGMPAQFTEELPYFDMLNRNAEFGGIVIPMLEKQIGEKKEQLRREEQARIEAERLAEEKRKERYDNLCAKLEEAKRERTSSSALEALSKDFASMNGYSESAEKAKECYAVKQKWQIRTVVCIFIQLAIAAAVIGIGAYEESRESSAFDEFFDGLNAFLVILIGIGILALPAFLIQLASVIADVGAVFISGLLIIVVMVIVSAILGDGFLDFIFFSITSGLGVWLCMRIANAVQKEGE